MLNKTRFDRLLSSAPLERYYASHCAELFTRTAECVSINPFAENVLRVHLPCAVSELPLSGTELASGAFGTTAATLLQQLATESTAIQNIAGTWAAANTEVRTCAQHRVSIRNIAKETLTVMRADTMREIDSFTLDTVKLD